jgi:hypothetical protein
MVLSSERAVKKEFNIFREHQKKQQQHSIMKSNKIKMMAIIIISFSLKGRSHFTAL